MLQPANGTSPAFGRVNAIRELPDGRVLVSDDVENRLFVTDPALTTTKAIGRNGSGPGEYRRPGPLYALSPESTLFMDAERPRRWLVLVGDSIVRTLPPDDPIASRLRGEIYGMDANGRILTTRGIGAEQLGPQRSRLRSVAVLASRTNARDDTVLQLRGYDQFVTQGGTREQPLYIVTQLLGSNEELVRLFPDGWLGVVRIDPYRVEWRTPDGVLIRGPELGWSWPRVDGRLKDLETQRRRLRGVSQSQPSPPWADRAGPIRGTALPTPEGSLLILRSLWLQPANDNHYDLVNRSGQLVGRLALPDSERVVGFGARSAYIAVTDADGFQRLRRHPWP